MAKRDMDPYFGPRLAMCLQLGFHLLAGLQSAAVSDHYEVAFLQAGADLHASAVSSPQPLTSYVLLRRDEPPLLAGVGVPKMLLR